MGLKDPSGKLTLAAPVWLTITAGALLVASVVSLFLAMHFSDRIEQTVLSIESRYTVGGWRNEATVNNAVADDPMIPRFRTGRTACFVAFAVFFTAALGAMTYELSLRKKNAAVLSGMTGEIRQRLVPEIRGFITLHIGTLAQKQAELRISNAYGVIDEGAWHQELVYFINRVLRPAIGANAELFTFIELKAMIEKQISMLG